MALPYFEQFGWRPTVLAVEAQDAECGTDLLLGESVPADADVIRVPALPARWTRKIGMGGLTYRARRYFKPRAEQLLASGEFDLVYFSTTEFPMMAWADGWRRRFGVPYVLDIQDPWVNDYYDRNPGVRRPGGFKHRVTQWLARRQEPRAVRGAGHVMCVSPGYPKMFLERYPSMTPDRFSVLPFAATNLDFDALKRRPVRQSVFDPADGQVHWVYVGRGGDDMAFSLRCLFTAVRQGRDAGMEWLEKLRIHFVGTDYAAGKRAKKSVDPIALECGVADLVVERPHRIPYFEALQCLLDADALVVPGSFDANYTASKIYPYLLAKKPLLAIFHEQSSVVDVIRSTRGGVVMTFDEEASVEVLADRIRQGWLEKNWREQPGLDAEAFRPFTAAAMTKGICECFKIALSSNS
jgi:hypothetical protein